MSNSIYPLNARSHPPIPVITTKNTSRYGQITLPPPHPGPCLKTTVWYKEIWPSQVYEVGATPLFHRRENKAKRKMEPTQNHTSSDGQTGRPIQAGESLKSLPQRKKGMRKQSSQASDSTTCGSMRLSKKMSLY
jgi:hypothetical protein